MTAKERNDIITGWVRPVATCLMVVAVCWLTREVVCLRRDYVELSARIEERQLQNERQSKDIKENSRTVADTLIKLDRNIVRLCERAGIKYD